MNQTNSNKNIYDKLEVEGINSNGYGIMPKIIMQDNRLTIEAKAIYAYIVSFAGAGNTAFPSLKKILCDLNISENRFYKHRKQLINCNYITLRQIRNDKKEIIKNIYTLVSNPKIEKEGGTLQNEGYPIPQNEGYPIPQNEGHIINSSKINNIKINNKKEDSQSSPSFLPDDDDYINTNKQSDKQLSQPNKEKLDTQAELKQIIKSNEHLKTFALALLLAGLKEIDCLEILEYLASLPEIDQQVSDIVNAQIRANEIEAQTNGLSNYKAYFLKGLKMKLDNASIFVKETDITDVKNKKIDTNVIIHNWL